MNDDTEAQYRADWMQTRTNEIAQSVAQGVEGATKRYVLREMDLSNEQDACVEWDEGNAEAACLVALADSMGELVDTSCRLAKRHSARARLICEYLAADDYDMGGRAVEPVTQVMPAWAMTSSGHGYRYGSGDGDGYGCAGIRGEK